MEKFYCQTTEQLEAAIKYDADKLEGGIFLNKLYDGYLGQIIKDYDRTEQNLHKILESSKK